VSRGSRRKRSGGEKGINIQELMHHELFISDFFYFQDDPAKLIAGFPFGR